MVMKALVLSLFLGVSVFAAETQTIYIKGMHCEGCISQVKAKICKLEGVTECDVKVNSAVLKVNNKIETAKFVKALEGTEFSVSETPVDQKPHHHKEKAKGKTSKQKKDKKTVGKNQLKESEIKIIVV